MTGESALDGFLTALAARDASEHTIRSYRTAVRFYLEWVDASGLDWTAVGRLSCRAYLAILWEGRQGTTVRQRLASIRSFYRWAARTGRVPGSAWSGIRTPKVKHRLPRVLSREEVERMLLACGSPQPVSL